MATRLEALAGEVAELQAEAERLRMLQKALGLRIVEKLEEMEGVYTGIRQSIAAAGVGPKKYGVLTADILGVVSARPEHLWSNAEILHALGYSARENVNATLFRLRKTGRVHRVGVGRYKIASGGSE